MHALIYSLVTTGSALLALAAPVANECSLRSEEQPWQITRLTTFDADEQSAVPSSIRFEFQDINDNLQLSTTCNKTATAGSGYKSDGYSPCSDAAVGFAFNGTELKVKRRYTAVSPNSCQPFPATAFGHATVDLKRAYAQGSPDGATGVTLYQDSLDITVTGIAA